MDPILIGGFILALLSMVVATLIDGNAFGPLVGPSSFVLVFFGTIGAALMAYRKADVLGFPKAALQALRGSPPDVDATVTTLGSLADVARREGMLALESRLADIPDDALRRGMQLLVDGLDTEQIREIIEIDIAAVDERHRLGIDFFTSLAGYSPTFGMLGTVVGLVNMLQNLTDPAQLGVGMALALLTTFYGVLFANLLWMPVANRLTRLNEQELAARDVALDGILAIQAGTSPRLLVERLETYLAPELRVGYAARAEAGPRAVAPPKAA